MPVGVAYMGMSEQQVLEKIRTTDLSETCKYVHIQCTGRSDVHLYFTKKAENKNS